MFATGRASVAPYGVNTSALSGRSVTKRSSEAADAGAPAEMTRFSVGKREAACGFASDSSRAAREAASGSEEVPAISPNLRITAGDPNMFVTPNCAICAAAFRGSSFAGRLASMSGITHVMPSAGPNSANSGNVQRSISPGSMP